MRTVTNDKIHQLIDKASQSPRKRAHYLLHKSHDEPVHRMINAQVPGSYVPPHMHKNPDKIELFCILVGRIACLKFSPQGDIEAIYILDEHGPVRIVDIRPGVYHSFVALKPSAMLEVIQGPYSQNTHKNWPDWAPQENTKEAAAYYQSLEAQVTKHLSQSTK